MGKFIVFSLILLFSPFARSLIQELTNPILPIYLGNAKVISSKHTFVSYLNISNFFDLRDNLKTQISFLAENKNINIMSNELTKQAWSLLSQVDQLLEAIRPTIRKRRGLINIGGTISKWLFGTLDHEDGERINLVLDHLSKNDHLLQEKINNEISLTKELMLKTNKSLFEIKSNVEISMNLIKQYQDNINVINALNLIINSLISLENSLNQLMNAITFAHLNKVHPTFLSFNNLQIMIQKMLSLYHNDQIAIFKEQHNFYKFLGIQIVFNKERIIFLIHFPILNSVQFKTYFVYPVPIQYKIIPPPRPYLILNEKTEEFQYEEELCEKIEETFYCKNHLEDNIDCIVDIITRNNASHCNTLSVHIDVVTANQVTPNNVLLTTPTTTLVTEVCQEEKHTELQSGSYLISLYDNCYIKTSTEAFYSSEDTLLEARVIQLPTLNMSLIESNLITIKLKSIDLSEIKHIASVVRDQAKLQLPKEIKPSTSSWSYGLWILTGVIMCLMTCIGVSCYYKISYPYPLVNLRMKKKKEEIPMTDESPTQPSSS